METSLTNENIKESCGCDHHAIYTGGRAIVSWRSRLVAPPISSPFTPLRYRNFSQTPEIALPFEIGLVTIGIIIIFYIFIVRPVGPAVLAVEWEEPDGDDVQITPLCHCLASTSAPIYISSCYQGGARHGLAAPSLCAHTRAHRNDTIRSHVTWVRHGPLLCAASKTRARCLRLDAALFLGNSQILYLLLLDV